MGFLHLFIVNKSGGLILHRPLSSKAPKLGTNEWLRIGSTFHSLHAIATEACPVRLPGGKNQSKITAFCVESPLFFRMICLTFLLFLLHKISRLF